MNKLVLSLSVAVFSTSLLLPSLSFARSIHPHLEEKQLEQQIQLLERKIAEMLIKLEDLRTHLCIVQDLCNEPEPEGKIVITEVLFNPGPTEVQGTDLDNEWIEVYNGTDGEVDLNGWSIGDGTATDVLSFEELILGSGKYLIITRSASTDTYWTYGAGTIVIHLESPIGSGGLSNAGESAILYDSESNEIDAVSWGSNTSFMNPSVDITGILEGQSIARMSNTVDTDTASDWQILEVPTPGS